MKLYSLLFLDEAARTPEEASSKGIAALNLKNRVVLFSVNRVLETTKKFLQKTPKTEQNESDYDEMLGTELAKRSIVGQVLVSPWRISTDLSVVNTSAGVNKFGPLAYQLAMAAIHPSWLMSDQTLTTGKAGRGGSADVWNKMYELSEQGVYERKWLGDYNLNSKTSPLVHRMNATPKAENIFAHYNIVYGTSEEGIQGYLEDHGLESKYSPSEFGYFWAYRLADPSSVNGSKLYIAGSGLVEDMKKLGVTDPERSLDMAGSEFFDRRYDE